MAEGIVLAGNSLALLVAACVLGRQGRRVHWVTDGRKPGGYFAGLRIGDDAFDLGSVLLERPGSGGPPPGLDTYDAMARYDSARFSGLAWDFFEPLLPVRRTPTAQCVLGERRVPDYLLSNRVDGLAGMDLAAPLPAVQAGAAHPWHARYKLAPGAYDTLDYADAARHNHGPAVQVALVDPFLRKLTGDAPWPFMARFHRAGWLPLYYPETVAQALAGEAVALPEYPFWLPTAGWCGALVEALLAEVARYPNVRRSDQPVASMARRGGGFSLMLGGGEVVDATALALGLPNERAHALLGVAAPAAPRAVGVRLLLLRVRQDAIGRPAGWLMVPDAAHVAYRVSDLDTLAGRDAPWHRVVVEAGLCSGAADDAALDARLRDELRRLMAITDPSAVQVVRGITVPQSLSLPSAAEVQAAHDDLARLHEAAKGILLCGAIAGFAASSLNDQLVQGLAMAQRLH